MPSLLTNTIFYRSANSTRNGPCSTAMWICNRWSHHAFSIGAIGRSWHFGSDSCVYESNYDQVNKTDRLIRFSWCFFESAPVWHSGKENPPLYEHSTYLVFFSLSRSILVGKMKDMKQAQSENAKLILRRAALTQWIDQRWQIGGRFIAHFDAHKMRFFTQGLCREWPCPHTLLLSGTGNAGSWLFFLRKPAPMCCGSCMKLSFVHRVKK